MDATPHLVVGAALTRKMNPAVAFVIGVASHALLDAIPHYNYTGWRPFSPIMVADLAVGGFLVMVIALMAQRPWGALAGAAGGIFPELERVLSGSRYDFLQRLPIALPQHETGLPWGLVTQFAVTALALAIGLLRRRAGATPTEGGRP